MLKRPILIAIMLIFGITSAYSGEEGNSKNVGIPGYMKIDFYQNYPDFQSEKMFNKVRYCEVPSEILKIKPNKIRFQSEDGLEIVNISQTAGWKNAQTETWMAIDPNNPQNLIATANDNYYLNGAGSWRMTSFWSKDGGRNWTQVATQPNEGVIFSVGNSGTIFDPGIVFNTQGEAFYCYGFTQTGKSDASAEQNAVIVQKSTDGGESWSEDWNDGLALSPVAYATAPTNNPFHDRYSIAIDQNENSTYRDNIYVSWQRFRVDAGPVFARSTDGGKSWSSPLKLENHYSTQAPMPAVGPNGEVYVAWRHQESNLKAQALVSKSTDGGATFTSPVLAQEVNMAGEFNAEYGRFTMPDKQDMRMSSPPQIAVDRSGGKYNGYVYVVQAGKDSENKYGVFLSRSTDNGNSWKKMLRVDDNALRNDMFFPSITVDPVSGLIAVLYYSSQNDPENVGVDAYVAVSEDAGNNWANIKVSPYTTYFKNSSTVFTSGWGDDANKYWGDYTSIVSYDSHIYPLFWLPSKESNFNFGTNDLFTAILSPAPKNVDNLTAESVIDGTVKVKLNWVNPTKTLFGAELTEYTIVINRDGQFLAELPKGTEEYFDENVVDGQRYNYEVIVKDNSDRLSTAEYVMVDAGGSIIPLQPYAIKFYPNSTGFEVQLSVPDTMIDGTEFRDFSKVELLFDTGEVLATIESIDDNFEATAQINMPTEKFYEMQFKTYSQRGGESNLSPKYFTYSGEISSELTENFDDLETMVPMLVRGKWSITDETAKSPSYSMTDNPYENYEPDMGSSKSAIVMKPVKLTDKTTLSFDYMALVKEQTGDVAEVNVYVLNKERVALKWFNRSISDKFGDDIASSEWDEMHLDLSEFVGETIMVEFALQSNGFVEDIGIFIDNVTIDNSPVSVIEKINNINIDLAVFPNPANSEAKLNMNLSEAGFADIDMYDILGNKVLSIAHQNVQPGQTQFNLDINNFANGSYMIKVNMNGKIKTVPFIISK